MSLSGQPTGLCLRPLVVRFTDPAMEDAHIDLVYERVDDDSERHWPRLMELTVGQVKQRRLRLIYLGRVLPNGIRLASWLDASTHEDEQSHSAAMLLEREPIDQENFTMKLAHQDGDISDKQRGKQRLLDLDFISDDVQTYDVLCLPTAFLQCSIGPSHEDAPPTHEIPAPNPTHEARGFDRLRYTAGMSALDVQTMREQFHLQSGLSRAFTGDLIRQEDEQDYAYRLEEQWIDNMGTAPIQSDAPSMSLCILQGMMIGFFFPLIPFFFTYESRFVHWPRPRRARPSLARTAEDAQRLETVLNQLVQQLEERQEQRGNETQTPEQERQDLQRTLTNFTNLLRVGEESQPTGNTDSLRSGEGEDPDADDDAEEESLPRRFLLRPARRDRYVIFQPYTLLAILLGFVCKYPTLWNHIVYVMNM
ncbi:hypothetical protein MCAP1_002147 [Malassezia caprae]|uniref:DSC E3 ubiquitin ligase complex subunit 3 C-terminal domain-containing protein n=1 Tax=Malassezia caprae TaxID=1381934 RepID=A0AAF0EBE5_9BASI|nr:hypothetical protein MCAP1_002147 [Malassezia caprae]